ncbi:MAG: NUDIX domain-containing protein [Comamonas sp.]|nr:NUDIX domain-containing protein [Comamonas sp.]
MPDLSAPAFTPSLLVAAPLTLHTAVVIGRFQPLHHGHMALIRQALGAAAQVVVVLGSAYQARTPKNPFTWQERAAMVSASFSAAEVARLHFVPMRDYYDSALWVAKVRQAVQALVIGGGWGLDASEGTEAGAEADIEARDTSSIGLVGHFKDASSSYLALFVGWQLISLERQGQFDGTPIRQQYWNLEQRPKQHLQAYLAAQMPAPVCQQLMDWRCTAHYSAMRKEWQMLEQHRRAWVQAPYPPVFVTVDALVLCAGHVLLIERGQHPGKGLLALPGGFLAPQDSLWQSCLRELAEETGWQPTPQAAAAALKGVLVFDHPGRSLRGRTITHVHVLHWPGAQLPAVQGADDAARALWLPLEAIASQEAQFFEDHFHLLRRCFAQWGGGPAVALA